MTPTSSDGPQAPALSPGPTAPDLSPYLPPEEREQRLEELSHRASGRLLEYGQSVGGRPLRAAVVAAAASEVPMPRVLCAANIHGPELISGLIALALLDGAGRAGSVLERLRQQAEVWVIPCLNPDGAARTWARGGRGSLAELRTNERGVDLNRNFPLPLGSRPSRLPGAGNARPGTITYRGPAPLSEPESAALEELFASCRFHAAVSLHSFMGTIIPARVKQADDYRAYRTLCRQFRQAQPRVRYRRLASRWLDVFTGELEDHLHHAHHCWAACIETMTIWTSLKQRRRGAGADTGLLWRFNPRDPIIWVENDLPAIGAFLEAALRLPRPPLAGPFDLAPGAGPLRLSSTGRPI